MSQKKKFSPNERDSLINHEMTDPQGASPFAVRKLRVGPGAWLLSSTPRLSLRCPDWNLLKGRVIRYVEAF